MLPMTILMLGLAGVTAQLGQGADGNPHGWDRKRRCDATQYSPACGICEGYGGIPYGDDNDEIHLSTCMPVPDTPGRKHIQPIWSTRMTMSPYYAVQIGPKLDPFCFQAIPGNQSNGKLCYQRQTGRQTYEMGTYNVLRFDVDLSTGLHVNVSSSVYARDKYLWIVNTLPLGIKQCICTAPKEGGDVHQGDVFPLQYNWTNHMTYIGLEKIFVEYVYKNMTLDHWSYGPHHVWTVPTTGSIIRMWQPFNGLQVMPNGTLESKIDPALLTAIPPKECLPSSHFTMKIKCNPSGYPLPKKPKVEVIGQMDSEPDMWRAKARVPRHAYKGETFEAMSETLNGWLVEAHGETHVKRCAEWNVEELQKLQASLYLMRFPAYDDVYKQADDNRQILSTLEDLQSTWTKLNEAAAETGMTDMHRDGHCHEAVMWFTHHLQEDVKKLLNAQGVVLPLLSNARHVCPDGASDGHLAVCAGYDYKVSCSDCHANVSPPTTSNRLLSAVTSAFTKLFSK